MIISKFYNRMKQPPAVKNDPRILTPNSIPIFILPPTLDKNTPTKHELNDNFECWSIGDEEAHISTSSMKNNNPSFLISPNSQSNFDQKKKAHSTNTSITNLPNDSLEINQEKIHLKNAKYSSDKRHDKPNHSIQNTSSLSNSINNNLFKPKIIISSIDNFNDITQTDQSKSSSQQSSRKSKLLNNYLNEENRKSAANNKNVFKSNLINNMQSIISNDNDEKLAKENYCKLWVLHGDSDTNMNNCAKLASTKQLAKVPSLNIELDENEAELNSSNLKTEEQLQREYLVNLLMQLSNEEEQQNNHLIPPDKKIDSDVNDINLIKKSKRSKSETFLTQNGILINNKNMSNILSKLSNTSANNKKSNNNLNIKTSNEAINRNNERRFSFLNIFSKQPVANTISCYQRSHHETSNNGLLTADENNINKHNFNNKLRANSVFDFNNSNNNNNNNNNNLNKLVDSNKILQKLNAVTAFKSQNNLNVNNNLQNFKRTSIFGSKSSNTLVNNNQFNNNSSISFNLDITDDDDYDKIFNEYLKKNTNIQIKIENNTQDNDNDTFTKTTTSAKTKNKKIKNIFKFIFKNKTDKNNNDSKQQLNNTNIYTLNNDDSLFSNVEDDYDEDYQMQTNQSSTSNETSFFKYDLEQIKFNSDFNLFSIDKELVKMKNNFKENEYFFIDSKLILKNNFHTRDKHNSLSSKDKVSIKTNKSNGLNINQFNSIGSPIRRQKSPRNSIITMASTNKQQFIHILSNPKKIFLNLFIDVSFERLQQTIQGHLISINLKNLRVDPLIEINYAKSRLSYVCIEQLDLESFMIASASTQNIVNLSNRNELSRLANNRQLAKVTRLKTKKCKFDNNFKNLSKPADFYLNLDHFMNVTEEATNIKLKSIFNKKDSIDNFENDNNINFENNDSNSIKGEKHFVFLFTIELHSYIPVSRKTLSSTFRKKKRIFKGQCQIHENFIKSTIFNKKFILHEI